jgi:radical SAM-linked protein
MNSEETITAPQPTRQRLRITFARDATLKYIGHLDMARTWQRILRRADLPLAYSEGFNPQPKITFAAALPVGCTSEHEVMDIVLSPARDVDEVRERLQHTLPPGIALISIGEVELHVPALQTQLIATEFAIMVDDGSIDDLADRVQTFLSATEVMRDRRGKSYNLRPLVQAISIEREPDRVVIRSRLQSTESGTGRPDELASALDLDPNVVKIHRTRLIFLDKTP